MQGVTDIEKLLLPMQFELVQGIRAKAVELLSVDPKHLAHLAAPSQNGAEDVV
jgi:hypothetical protein